MPSTGTLVFNDQKLQAPEMYATESLGVGVSVPTSNLEVTGNVYVSSNLEIGTANLFVDTTTGNVGIGTVSPGVRLHVNGAASATHTSLGTTAYPTLGGNWLTIFSPTFDGDLGDNHPDPDGGILFTNESSNGSLPWGYYMGVVKDAASTTATSQRFDIGKSYDLNSQNSSGHADTLTPYLTIDNGNVGIGTANPTSKLHIQDDNADTKVTIRGGGTNVNDSNVSIELFETASGFYGATIQYCGTLTDQGLRFGHHVNTATPRFDMVIDRSTGNVGIGTVSPKQKLEVHGNMLLGDNDVQSFIHGGADIAVSADTNVVIVADSNDTSGAANAGNIIFGSGSAVNTNQNRDFTFAQAYPSNVPRNELMRITGSGNVGIGTNSPNAHLHISSGTDGDCVVRLEADTDNDNETDNARIEFISDGGFNTALVGAGQLPFSSENLNALVLAAYQTIFYTGVQNFTDSTNMVERMRIGHTGNIGIGITNPANQKLEINGGLYIFKSGTQSTSRNHNANKWILLRRAGNKIAGEGPGISFQGSYYRTADYNNHYGMIQCHPPNNNDDLKARMVFYVNDGTGSSLDSTDIAGYFDFDSSGGQVNFTGQHRTFIKDIPTTQSELFEGLIVSANQNKYVKMNGGIEAGSNAVTINESLPIVSLSNVASDKKCFGVISYPENSETREDRYGRLFCRFKKEPGDTRVYINSAGEGAIWVTNINGNLESGDYITTSNVAGYGMRQDDDILHNYTVAKITMDCDFEPATQPVQQIVKELSNVNYWVETTYTDVDPEEYSNLAEENRRTVTDNEIVTYQKIERTKSTTEHEEWTHEVHRELVNVLDEHGQLQWEDHPTETEKAYKIRYLTSDGQITDEANAVHIAAFVGCTYHCG